MASAMRVFRKFRSSDGRIRIKTLSGVSALIAVVALLVGVLPAMADHLDNPATPANEGALVSPVVVSYGGGSGACDFVDSAASNELHINNPTPSSGDGEVYTDAAGNKIKVKVYDIPPVGKTEGRVFDFEVVSGDIVVYDVVVNGGPQNNWYAYDGSTVGTVTSDKRLHAPRKNANSLHNLSHVNICYDAPGLGKSVLFVCGAEAVHAYAFGEDEGDFTDATAQIFNINGETPETCEKNGSFFIKNNRETTLSFGTGEGFVEGRADFFKEFDTPPFTPLTYDGGPATGFEEVPWCTIDGGTGAGFTDVVSGDPQIPANHTACKVYEEEVATGDQWTVIAFKFVDPNFR